MNKLIEFFIKNVKLNYVLFVFIILGGIYSYKTLPKEIFPPITTDKISIKGSYSGASANILNKMAVQNIEDEINNISGISKITSYINSGFFDIVVEIANKEQKDTILQKVKDSVSKVKRDLPSDMNEPTASHIVGIFPLILVNISSEQMSHDYILNAAKELKSKLSTIKNLTNINIYGEGSKQVKIEINSNILKAYGIDTSLFLNAISNMSSIFPIGEISQQSGKNYFISTFNGEKNIEDFLQTKIKIAGKIIRLKDVATISKAYKNDKTISSFNGRKTVSINVSKTKDGNSMELVKKVKYEIEKFQKQYPKLSLGTFSDTSVYIRNRLNTVVSNILLGLILVGFAMYLLINKRISFVVILGVPTSFVISLIIFKYFGYSINMMSLLGALIALGVIVDDAIIVAENIQRHIEEGMEVKDAALKGTKEVFAPVLASSLTTIFAFLPMLVLSGEMGVFIKIIPIAITVLIISSVIESFIFLPLHAKHVLKKGEKEVDWSLLANLYEKIIRFLIDWRKTTLALFYILVPLLIYTGISTSKFKLFPTFDGDQINIRGQLPINTTLEESNEVVKDLERYLLKNKDKYFIQNITAMAGFKMNDKQKGEIGDNMFHIFVDLKRAKPDNFVTAYITPYLSFDYDDEGLEREIPSYKLEHILQKDLDKVMAKYKYEEFKVSGPRAGVVNTPIEIYIQTNDDKKAHSIIKQIKTALKDTNETINIKDNATYGVDEIKLKINKYGQSLGISERLISRELGGYFLGSSVSKGFDNEGIFDIVTQDFQKNSLQTLKDFTLSLANGQKVALKDVADFIIVKNYTKIYKEGGKRRWLVSSHIKPKANVNDVLAKIKPLLRDIETTQRVKIVYGGEEQQNNQLKQDMSVAAMIAIFLIFMTLLVMFNSFKYTFIILSVIPFSILGVFLGHKLMGLDLSVPSIIGALGLAGVVINDGIIMLDFIRHSKNIDELLDRAKLRLRPIFLTSITTLVGLSTLIFFPSGQAVIMQPLAVSLGFGLFWGTFLNLVYLPTLFALLTHQKQRIK